MNPTETVHDRVETYKLTFGPRPAPVKPVEAPKTAPKAPKEA